MRVIQGRLASYFVLTIASFKAQIRAISKLEHASTQVLFTFVNMTGMLLSITFFYAMLKAEFMSNGDYPIFHLEENLRKIITPSLSDEGILIDLAMMVSYALWLGCFCTCICIQPRKDKN